MRKTMVFLLLFTMLYSAYAETGTAVPLAANVQGVACTMEAMECPDGSYVGRVPPDCAFEPCPTALACPTDAKQCPDGTYVGRIAPDCEFAPCRTETLPVEISLPADFWLSQGNYAIVSDNDMMVRLSKVIIQKPLCKEGEPCPEETPYVKLEISYAVGGGANVATQVLIAVGETKTFDDVKFHLIEVTEGRAHLKAALDEDEDDDDEVPAPVVLYPQCQKQNGVEGWYSRGELIKEEKCLCTAECRNIGSRSEGFYSTCTDKLIVYAFCKDAKPIDPSTPVRRTLEVRKVAQGYEVGSGDVAISKIAITVNEDRLEMATDSGVKQIVMLPEEAKQTALSRGLQQVNAIEIIAEGDRPVYKVSGTVVKKLLWIIPYTASEDVYVDAGSEITV
jgi:hypothetical protein